MKFNDKNGHFQAFLTIALIITVAYFVIRPITLNTYAKYLQVVKYKSDIDKMKLNLQSLNTIDRINRDYKDEIRLVDKVIPSTSNEQEFIKDLSVLCGKNKINLIKTTFTHLNDSVTFAMEFEGSYENFPPLLKDINNMLRLTSLETINVAEVKESPLKGSVYIQTTGRIFKKAQQ